MPIFTVEDGTGLAQATSYASVVEADDYFSAHPFYADNWNELGESDKENLLMTASTMLDSIMTWNGTIYSNTQGLGWPRSLVFDSEYRPVASNVVPRGVKIATMELAMYLWRNGDVFEAPSSTGVDRLKIDVIELQFSSTQNGGSRGKAPVPAAALLALRGLGEYTLGTRVRRVQVG
jgi:hypothetical protein